MTNKTLVRASIKIYIRHFAILRTRNCYRNCNRKDMRYFASLMMLSFKFVNGKNSVNAFYLTSILLVGCFDQMMK